MRSTITIISRIECFILLHIISSAGTVASYQTIRDDESEGIRKFGTRIKSEQLEHSYMVVRTYIPPSLFYVLASE